VTIPRSIATIGQQTFYACYGLTNIYFTGNPPVLGPFVFTGDNNATVYYLPGTSGWTNSFAGLLAVLWNPVIQTSDAGFGLHNDQFGFNIAGTANIPILVEACTNLANPVWSRLETVALTNGLFYFTEPFQPNTPARFYVLGFP
jgi:hypothetical protein